MQGRIKRPLLYLKNVTRHLLNALGNGPTVLRTKRERSQDKEVESTLRKVDPLGWHVFPFRFYTEQYSSSCRSARGKVRPTGGAIIGLFEEGFRNPSRVVNRQSAFRGRSDLETRIG